MSKRTYAGMVLVLLLTACGGGGGGNPNPTPTLLPALRYFPSPLGAQYVYRTSNVTDPLFDFTQGTDLDFTLTAGPAGGDVVYGFTDQFDAHRSPDFSGLSFKGLVENGSPKFLTGGADTADVLPATLTAIGQSWPLNLHLGLPGQTFIARYVITGSFTLAAVEDVTVGNNVFHNCVRVDASFDYNYLNQPIPGLTGSYWLAPDIGLVQGVCRLAGVEIGRVQLINLTAP